MASGDSGVPLPNLNWDYKDQTLAFNEWKDFLESYFAIRDVAADKKWHYVLLSSGPKLGKGRELWNTWCLPEDDKKDVTKVFKKFEDYLIGMPNKWVMRLELSAIKQNDTEQIDDFICRLRMKAKNCGFNQGTVDDQITFQLIKGMKWPEARRKLISKGNDLKLDDAIKCAQEFQATMQNTSSFQQQAGTSINAFYRKSSGKTTCDYCKTSHPPRKCPAYGMTCDACGKRNHFKIACKSERKDKNRFPSSRRGRSDKARHRSRSRDYSKKTIHALERETVVNDDCDLTPLDCGSVVVHADGTVIVDGKTTRESIRAKLEIKPPGVSRQVTLRVKADTGANGNLMPMRCLEQMYPVAADRKSVLQPSNAQLIAVNDTSIKQLGCVDMAVRFDKSEWITCRFYVHETDGPAILSCDASEKLGIINISTSKNISALTNPKVGTATSILNTRVLQELYPDRFRGISNLPGEYDIELKKDAEPHITPPRKYPIHLKPEICRKLKEMEQLGVIAKCDDDESSDWINALAFSRKASGELRICLDPRKLNTSIKRTYHKAPTLDEISHQLAGSSVYSKLDAKNGYWGIKLTTKSSKLCTFQSPAGKYRFLRLPFGLCVSQDIFQSRMDRILTKAGNGVNGIADDVIVYGKDIEEHDDALHRLMRSAQDEGLVFRLEKCDIRTDSISFFGSIWTKDGVKPDPKKCDNITEKSPPTSTTELSSFLGVVQYLSPFIPQLSAKTKVMRQLMKGDATWEWTAECQKSFDTVKQAINKDLLLRYFDPMIPVEIEVDASLKGLGAALLQNGRPIAFASKSLSAAESNYANIEREMLSVVFGLEHFHCFVYGKPVTIHSDHKPLQYISVKQLSQAPPRLQRMLLRIQPYEVDIRYRPGKEMAYADYLSRVSPSYGPAIPLEYTIHMIQISVPQLERVKLATQCDPELSALREQVIQGWPDDTKTVPKIIRSYWSMRDYISVEDGVLFTGTKMIVPRSMRQEYLERIHTGHLGIIKSQLRAKQSLYWPGMNAEIETHVRDCQYCLQNARFPVKEKMIAHEIPTQPWQLLSSDLFELDGHTYVLLVDHYSKMPFARLITKQTSAEVIKFCKDLFAVHGICKRLYTDNGPQYASSEFRNFAMDWDFEHITSSPRYPQSNGFIERMVGVVKQILKKAHQSKTDPQLALLCYRSTPLDSQLPSPAELLYNRKIRTNLPDYNPNGRQNEEVYQRFCDKSKQSQEYYDKTAGREQANLLPGMKVLYRDKGDAMWTPATVVEQSEEPRSYVVSAPSGAKLRRNRRHIKELTPTAARKFNFTQDNDTTESSSTSVLGPQTQKEQQPKPTENTATGRTQGVKPSPSRDKPQKSVHFNVPNESTLPAQPRRSSRIRRKPERLVEQK